MGGGFLGVAASTSLVVVGPALLAGAIGFGLISTLGFPLFSQLIPAGEEGGYSALYFSVRAISSTIALPTAGWLIAVTGTYRTLFVLGGIATLAALVPLSRVRLPRLRRGRGAVGARRDLGGHPRARDRRRAHPPAGRRRVALPPDQRPRPRPGLALDGARPAHAQLPRS